MAKPRPRVGAVRNSNLFQSSAREVSIEPLERRNLLTTFNLGDLVVADFGAVGGTGALIRVTDPAAAQTTLVTGSPLVDPKGVAQSSAGVLYVADAGAFGGSGAVFVFDPATDALTLLSRNTPALGENFVDPTGIVATADRIFVADPNAFGGSGGIISIDPATGVQTVIARNAPGEKTSGHKTAYFVDPTGIAQDPSTGTLLIADPNAGGDGHGAIIRVDPQTGERTFVTRHGGGQSQKLRDPIGVARAGDGSLYIADPGAQKNGAILKLPAGSDEADIFASGGPFKDPSGIAIRGANLFVADPGAFGGGGGVIKLDRATGALVATFSGGSFVNPFGIAVIGAAPVAANDGENFDIVVNEDTTLTLPAPGVLANDSDPDGDPLSAVLVTGPAHGTLTLNADGSFTYEPDADYNQFDTFTYRASDGTFSSAPATVKIFVNPVNDAPSFTLNGGDVVVAPGSGPQVFPNRAIAISAGPPDEQLFQTVSFLVSNDNPALFAVQPAISTTGTLTFTSAGSLQGTANITVVARDSGGTGFGGDDSSPPQFFTITIASGRPASTADPDLEIAGIAHPLETVAPIDLLAEPDDEVFV